MSQRAVLEMWLEANERGVSLLPPSSPWIEVALELQDALRADIRTLGGASAKPQPPAERPMLRIVR